MGLATAIWLAGMAPVGARTPPADVQAIVTVATAAVREAFGGEADVTLSQPVLSLAGDAGVVTRAVPEPASRTAGPVRFVLYASIDGTERRVGRLTARVDVAATHVRVSQPVAARAAIAAQSVEVLRGDIGRQALGVLPAIGAVTGAITRKALVPGEVVTQVVIVSRALVSSGDEVITVARLGALEVRGRAIAAQSGGLGETVIVVNPDSRKRLRGRIVGSAVVEVLHGS
jgi:flagella basal body P-ring formation protein FlgA